jgi:hypothetical protein
LPPYWRIAPAKSERWVTDIETPSITTSTIFSSPL